MALSGSALAQSFALGDIEGGGGLVSVNNDIGSGILLSGRVGVGELLKGFELEPEVTFWSASQQIGSLSITNRDFMLSANLRYWLGQVSAWRPYLGGGLGWNFVSTKAKEPRFGEASISKRQFSPQVFGGARYQLSDSLGTFGEVRYVVSSETNHLWVWGGLSYRLN